MPIKNMIGIIIAVAMGIFAYTEITARLTSLETSRELMKTISQKSEQVNYRPRTIFVVEDLFKSVEKITKDSRTKI